MDDILPGEIEKWQWVEEKARIFFEAAGFKEIRTPLLEPTELFTRSIGESTDIVHKEMYTFEDRGKRSMTLRPEMTASVARCVVEKGLLTQAKSLRFYYIGPMFRAERPQAGRKRQFHQIGVEIINEGAAADLESIALLYKFLQYVGLSDIQLNLNDLGEEEGRVKVRKALTEYFSKERSRLCKDCQWRLEKNVLRVFDCKIKECQPVIESAPWENFFPLSESFKSLEEKLKTEGIPYRINRRLVRGLDYYNGVVFEITAEGLGAQNAVAGGGRYDRLYQDLGGKQTPATGFSLGVERLIAALEKSNPDFAKLIFQRYCYIAPIANSPEVERYVTDIVSELIKRGYRCMKTPGVYGLDAHLKKANQFGVRYMAIIGSDEAAKGTVAFKDLNARKQENILKKDFLFKFEEALRSC
ncbi:MAG TPA: histidine--tRNA ligase [Candidatus Omnitrophota bacterium]|nr:histidine--tRNA ligase [Candidatus Omnitrophota bacterium]